MNLPSNNATMSSKEIAELTGKLHKNVMRDIRNMQPAWQNVTGRKFELSEFKDSTGRKLPMFKLTQKECLFIATKFNDEARAKLVLRWYQLETKQVAQVNHSAELEKLTELATQTLKGLNVVSTTLSNYNERISNLENQVLTNKPPKHQAAKLALEVIDARAQEYDFAKINGHNVRRIIVNERVYYSINDILQAIGVSTGSGQVAKKLNRNAPHTVAKIHIFGNTHPAWFCTKHGIDLIQSGSRKLNGSRIKCELN